MSAALLWSIFSCSAVHPQRRLGYATYVPRELWDGVDVLAGGPADPYRVNATDLLSGLETVRRQGGRAGRVGHKMAGRGRRGGWGGAAAWQRPGQAAPLEAGRWW